MKAQFTATCRACRHEIQPGDEIFYGDAGAKHQRCRDRQEKPTRRERAKSWARTRIRSNRVWVLTEATD
jgi:hypothetical protein